MNVERCQMEQLVSLNHVSKYYSVGNKKKFSALRDISLTIGRGETLGIVGESGSGKSTLARIVMGIERPDGGTVHYAGEPVVSHGGKRRLSYAKNAQIIFQDSFASLDPRMTVETIISEGMEIQKMFDREGRKQRVQEMLAMVGLEKEHGNRYPHEFSGGQRQRICIARALAVTPEFLVCDEPISALDVSVQSHIMNLLMELKERFGLTYLFIAHNLNMVNYISDRIAVMYLGEIMELGSSNAVCLSPLHPYTKLLLDSVLLPDPEQKSLDKIQAESYDAADRFGLGAGCAFAGSCPLAADICRQEVPVLREVEADHFAACHYCK